MNIKCIAVFFVNFTGVVSLKILTIISTPTKSHHIWVSSLTAALAKRGHEVMFVTPHQVEEQVPNLNVIILESPPPETNQIGDKMIQSFRDTKSSFEQLHYFYLHKLAKCESHYDRQPLKSLIQPQSSVQFDLRLRHGGLYIWIDPSVWQRPNDSTRPSDLQSSLGLKGDGYTHLPGSAPLAEPLPNSHGTLG